MAEVGTFKSIVNLRVSQEDSFMHNEGELCKGLGLAYLHAPMSPATLTAAKLDEILGQVRVQQMRGGGGGRGATHVCIASVAHLLNHGYPHCCSD